MPEHTGVGESSDAITRIGWLVDHAGYVGGAELTQAEFRAAAPGDAEIVDCPPGGIVQGLDRYVIHNCVSYARAELEAINGCRAVKYWHDVGPHLQPGVRIWLDAHTEPICCSPAQAEYINLKHAYLVPPAIDYAPFEQAAALINGNRAGAVAVGAWRNLGKAPHKAAEWAHANGGIDFYGSGPFAPAGSREVAYDDMPALLARYETFVHLPTVLEPFGRALAEAWAAGCEIVTNGLVGAAYWIEQEPDKLDTAARDFWRIVLR